MAPTAFWIKSKSLNEAYKILKELVALQFHTLSFSVLYSISSHNKLLSVQKVQWEITTSTFLCLFAQDVLSARNNPPPLQTSTPRLSLNIHFLWGKRLCSLLKSGEVPLYVPIAPWVHQDHTECLLPSHLPSPTRLQQPGGNQYCLLLSTQC